MRRLIAAAGDAASSVVARQIGEIWSIDP